MLKRGRERERVCAPASHDGCAQVRAKNALIRRAPPTKSKKANPSRCLCNVNYTGDQKVCV